MGAVGSLNRAIEFGGTRREYEQVQSPLLAGLLKLGGELAAANTRATAATAAQFLDTLQHRMPFPIRAVQVDGGSEFAAEFEQACQQRGLHLLRFELPQGTHYDAISKQFAPYTCASTVPSNVDHA